MIQPQLLSPFTDPAAVEAWDAWFRWRDGAGLRDVSIEDTWLRVAAALASVEAPAESAAWQSRLQDALSCWRLLPDERLLASAGTGRITWSEGALHASLNAATFVWANAYPRAAIDLAALAECAALAVRALDNAARLAGIEAPQPRIGLIGVADALALLGLKYDSEAGRAMAATLAKTLAEGCLRGNIALASERGAHARDTRTVIALATLRGMPHELVADASRHGVRHARLTAITSRHRLALLANDVADALDPLRGEGHSLPFATPDGVRTMHSSGYALAILRSRRGEHDGDPDTLADLPWTAQISMRAALQPWMDEPIACPLLVTGEIGEPDRAEARRQAELHGLGRPVWRDPSGFEPL